MIDQTAALRAARRAASKKSKHNRQNQQIRRARRRHGIEMVQDGSRGLIPLRLTAKERAER